MRIGERQVWLAIAVWLMMAALPVVGQEGGASGRRTGGVAFGRSCDGGGERDASCQFARRA